MTPTKNVMLVLFFPGICYS